MLLDLLPLSQTVTPSRTPPLEHDFLYGRPLLNVIHAFLSITLHALLNIALRYE